ncbi:GtrA family protein [Ruegeria arenilitoris]|uniref:GtrA family protein n=1 Tax=Ruegeria arenilitoris TaxID=1173585 RepID=UPI001C2BD051
MTRQRPTFILLPLNFIGGLIALGVHLVVMSLLIMFTEINAVVASVIGFFCAIPVNYIFQRKIVFRSSARVGLQFLTYTSVTMISAVLNAILFAGLWKILHPNYILTQIIVTAVIFLLNFFVNKNITFARRR